MVEEILKEVLSKLPKNITVHMYKSHTTDSVYIKFDWGVLNTLRISEHSGKSYLKYMYEINEVYNKSYTDNNEFGLVYKYCPQDVDKFIKDFIRNSENKKAKINNYSKYVQAVKNKIDYSRGFWSGAKILQVCE